MTRTCTICRHPDEHTINLALLSGAPLRSIAVRHGVSKTSLTRHKLAHLPRDLVQARHTQKIAEADLLLANVCKLQSRTEDILVEAETSGDARVALAAIREMRSTLEFLARLAGELRDSPQVNVLITPEYQRLRTLIVEALAPYPEARAAVARALRDVVHAGP